MSPRRSSGRDRDDRLLDAAGLGADALEKLVRSGGAGRDPLFALLAQWHDDVADGTEVVPRPAVPDPEVTDGPPAGAVAGGRHNGVHPTADLARTGRDHRAGADGPLGVAAHRSVGTTRPPVPKQRVGPGGPERPAGENGSRRRRRGRRLSVALSVVALAAATLGGVAIGAGGAGPDSPLWPVTKAFYPERADSRLHQAAAQKDLDDAQHAVAAGDTADARRYLDDAGRHLDRVKPSTETTKLRHRADRMRDKLNATGTVPGAAVTGATPSASASGNGKAKGKGLDNGKDGTPGPTPDPGRSSGRYGTRQGGQGEDGASPSGSASPTASPTPRYPRPSKTDDEN